MNILIVDDRPSNLKLLRAQLECDGANVSEAADGVEALRVLKSGKVDAIISDILMPRMDGFQLCQKVREGPQSSHLPFIAYSAGETSSRDEARMIELGADRVLRKPASATVFAGILGDVVQSRAHGAKVLVKPLSEAELLREYNGGLLATLEERNLELETNEERLAKSEEELRAARAHLQRVLAHSSTIIYDLMWKKEKIILKVVSQNIKGLLGFDPDESLNYDWWVGRLHPDDRSGAVATLAESPAAGACRTEYRMLHKDGSIRWVEDYREVVCDAHNRPQDGAGAWTDITERKCAGLVIKEERLLWQTVLATSLDAWLVIQDQKLVLANLAAVRLLAAGSEEELRNRDASSILHPAALTAIMARARLEIEASGSAVPVLALQMQRMDGTFADVEINPVEFQFRGRPALLVEARDKSERSRAGRVLERQQLSHQFRQAQKMQALGALATGIAHDFNNILGAITIYGGLAQGEAKGNILLTQELDGVMISAQRARALVQQIMTFSRGEQEVRRPIQLWQVATEALHLLRAGLPASIEFQISLSKEAPTVLANETQIHQVLMNLGTNAAHAMREKGGRLTVTLADCLVDAEFAAAHTCLYAGRYARLTVGDDGHGMDAATQARIFQPFFTTKLNGEGSGIGLAVVNRIVKSHEGAIVVVSAPGEGTSFQVYFPEHRCDAIKTAVNAAH